MAGPRDKKPDTSRDAASDFFDDDDDWFDDEDEVSAVVPSAPVADPDAESSEPPPATEPDEVGAPVEAVTPAPSEPEPAEDQEEAPSEGLPEPAALDDAAPDAAPAPATEDAAAKAEAVADAAPGASDVAPADHAEASAPEVPPAAAAPEPPKPPIAPPPPPPYVAPKSGPRAKSGYLDSILPQTLAPPRLATAAPPVAAGPDMVDAIGVHTERKDSFTLPVGDEAWREIVAVIELEAASDEAKRGALFVQSAWVRLRMLGDKDGAVARLRDAAEAGIDEDVDWHTLHADALWTSYDAWAGLAKVSEGAAAADAWRRAASCVDDPGSEREALEAAVAADPADLSAWQRLLAVLAAYRDDDALIGALTQVAAQSDPSSAATFAVQRGAASARVGRLDDAAEAFRAALDADATRGDAWLGLEAALRAGDDHGGLAALYAARAQEDEQGAPVWWQLAAQAHATAGDADASAEAWTEAVAAGSQVARVLQEGRLLAAGSFDALADALSQRDDDAVGASWYRLAIVAERAGHAPAKVLSAYRAAAEAGFAPASRAVERSLEAAGDLEGLVALVKARVKEWDVPRAVDVARLAEVLEAQDPASTEAMAQYRSAADKGDLEGLRGLARTAQAGGDDAAYADAITKLAEREVDPDLRAARAYDVGVHLMPSDPDAAVRWFERAAQGAPGDVLVLEQRCRALQAAGRAGEAATAMLERAASVDDAACVPWYLGAAALVSSTDREAGMAAYEALLARVPDHPVALRRLERVAGARRPDLQRRAFEIDGTELGRLAMACLEVLSGGTLDDAVTGEGYDTLRAVAAVMADDEDASWFGALAASTQPEHRTVYALGLAQRDPDAAVAVLETIDPAAGTEPLVRLAERLGRTDLALGFAEASGCEGSELTRLRLSATDEPAVALELVRGDLEDGASSVQDLIRVAQLAEAAADRTTHHKALARLASSDAPGAVRAAYATALAMARAGAGEPGEASQAWRQVFALRPGSIESLRHALDALVAAGDADGLTTLFSEQEVPARMRASAWDELDDASAVVAWGEAAEDGALLDRLGLEHALGRSEAWSDLFDAWSARVDVTQATSEVERLERKRRWVLAEKLAETDRAWELYQQLHEEDPEDRDVLESLARIAGARGEVDTAVGYLADLAGSSTSPQASARYQRRIAEVHLGREDDAAARQAFFDALDYDPEDLSALGGLRELAERTEDFETLHTVLKRESTLVAGTRRLDVQRELARLAQDKLHDTEQAMDGWRTVLLSVPGDEEALRRMLEMADASGDHELFLEMGQGLVAVAEGAERSDLLRRMGERCEAQQRVDDAIHFFEQAISAEVPDLGASQRLEVVYGLVNDQAGVVRTLLVQAELLTEASDKVAALHKAASIELDQRHDREAAHRVFERVLAIAPEDQRALRYEAAYLYESSRYAEALPVHERLEPIMAAEDDLDDYDVRMEVVNFYFRFAEMLRSEGQTEDAKARYEHALELNPTHLPTLEAVGPIYVAEQSWKEAGDVYQRLLQLTGGQGDPEQVADMFTMLGVVERENDQLDKAFKRFNRALEAFPNYVPALKGVASVHEARENWPALLAAYNGVIYNATVPLDVIDAYMTKGRVLDEHMEREDKAAQHYERSLSFEANQPKALLRLMEMKLRRSAYEEAIDFAVRGIGFCTEDAAICADLCLGLALARQATEDVAGAQEALQKATELAPDVVASLGDAPLDDADAVKAAIRARLPR